VVTYRWQDIYHTVVSLMAVHSRHGQVTRIFHTGNKKFIHKHAFVF